MNMSRMLMYLGWGWLIGTTISVIIEGAFFGSEEQNLLNDLTLFTTLDLFGMVTVPSINVDFFLVGIPRLLLWDYAMFSGGWAIFKLPCYILDIGAVWGFYQIVLGIISYAVRR